MNKTFIEERDLDIELAELLSQADISVKNVKLEKAFWKLWQTALNQNTTDTLERVREEYKPATILEMKKIGGDLWVRLELPDGYGAQLFYKALTPPPLPESDKT